MTGRETTESALAVVHTPVDSSEAWFQHQQAEEARAHLGAIIEASGDAIYSLDLDYNIRSWNAGAARLLGYSREEILGNPLSLLVPPNYWPEALENLSRVRAGETISPWETIRRKKDGELIDVSITISPIRFGQTVTGICIILRDIAEQKRTQHALEASEERLRLAVEGAELGTWHWNIRKDEIVWSDQCKAICGLAADVVMNHEVTRRCLHPDDRERVVEAVRQALADKTEYQAEYRVVWPDGSVHWVLARGRGYYAPDGSPLRLEGIAFDITARKVAEAALHESEARFRKTLEENGKWLRLITDTAPVLIAYVDTDECFRFANRHYADWFGKPLERIVDHSVREVLGETAYEGVRSTMEAALASRSVTFERLMRYADAPARYIRGAFVPDVAPGGQVRGFVSVVTDISDIRKAEEERERSLSEIEALNARLRRAMTETHHRVRNNLQVIAALLDMQSEEAGEPASASELQRIGMHIRALAAIHNILTDRAKEDGEGDTASAGEILTSLLPMLQNALKIRHLEYEVADITLSAAQGTSLAIIVNELVSNAVKYGGGEIRLLLFERDGAAVLEIRDHGPGFPLGFQALHPAHTGLELIDNLTRWDLRGYAVFENCPEGGACVQIVFPPQSV